MENALGQLPRLSGNRLNRFFGQGVAWGYMHPTVRDRLLNYYATDKVFEDIQLTVNIAKALPDYAQRIYELQGLITRSNTLVDLADRLEATDPETGIKKGFYLDQYITGLFFEKVTDLVAAHTNLVWYGRADITAIIYDVLNRKPGYDFIYDRIGDIKNIFDDGILPTIRERASFLSDLEVLGRFNKIEEIMDWVRDTIDPLHFTMDPFDAGWVGTSHVHWDNYEDWGYGLDGFRNWMTHIRWLIGEIRLGHTPLAYIIQFPMHLSAGFPFLEKIGDFFEKFKLRVDEGGFR